LLERKVFLIITRKGFIAELEVDIDEHPGGEKDPKDGNAEDGQGPAPALKRQ
jgi:hypothetical protein